MADRRRSRGGTVNPRSSGARRDRDAINPGDSTSLMQRQLRRPPPSPLDPDESDPEQEYPYDASGLPLTVELKLATPESAQEVRRIHRVRTMDPGTAMLSFHSIAEKINISAAFLYQASPEDRRKLSLQLVAMQGPIPDETSEESDSMRWM